ncbi:MAG: hypothetical protein AAFQ42_02985 [Pseudomonadota bacterium]
MPWQNRVTPWGEIITTSARGTMMGNRGGCFHHDDGSLGRRRWASRAWICCVLEFKDRRRTIRQPGKYTELFFLDEVTALAAGHRPCAECRRADFLAFAERWNQHRGSGGRAYVAEMDPVLHAARLTPPQSIVADCADLPPGTMIETEAGDALLLWNERAWLWDLHGYTAIELPTGKVRVITPDPILDILRLGYRPRVHPSAE